MQHPPHTLRTPGACPHLPLHPSGAVQSGAQVVEKVVERVVVERDEEAEARLRELEEQSKREEEEIECVGPRLWAGAGTMPPGTGRASLTVGAAGFRRKKSKEEAEKLRKAHEETLRAKQELSQRLQREEEERERARQVGLQRAGSPVPGGHTPPCCP